MGRRRTTFDKEKEDIQQRLLSHFGDARGMLAFMVIRLSVSGQPCDITFHDRSPILDVKVDSKLSIPLMYGAGSQIMDDRMQQISLSNGEVVAFDNIWTVHPMPVDGLSKEELAAVDLGEGEQRFGPNGETLREMIRSVYHCTTSEEEELFLRRYLAS